MKLRVAKHTDNLPEIIRFYKEVLLLNQIGSFDNHDNYDGVFFGGSNWELEFTTSNVLTNRQSDEDDLLVLYLSKDEMDLINKNLKKLNIQLLKSRNPYWQKMGLYFKDPDGNGIIIAHEDKSPII